MENVLLIIHLIIALILIGAVLLQRSEGGGLGVGGDNNRPQTRVRERRPAGGRRGARSPTTRQPQRAQRNPDRPNRSPPKSLQTG